MVRTLEATELSQQETQELKTTEVRKLPLLLSLVDLAGWMNPERGNKTDEEDPSY